MKALGILAVAIAAVCTSACNKDKPEVSTTRTTASEIELGTDLNAAPAPAAQKDDQLAMVRREQLTLRSRINEQLGTLDHQLTDLRRSPDQDQPAIDALTQQRQTLEADALVLDHSDERGWDELKAVVEHDLEGAEPQ